MRPWSPQSHNPPLSADMWKLQNTCVKTESPTLFNLSLQQASNNLKHKNSWIWCEANKMQASKTHTHTHSKNISFRVILFSYAAVTKYHKLGILKQHVFISHISGDHKTEISIPGPKSRCLQGPTPSRSSRGRVLLSSPRFWWLQHSSSVAVSLGHYPSSFACVRSPVASLFWKHLWLHFGPTQII